MKVLVLSNMYPTPKNPMHGVFVKNAVDELESQGATVSLVKVNKKSGGLFRKLLAYLVFCLHATKEILTKDFDILYIHYPTFTIWPLVAFNSVKKILGLNKRRFGLVVNFHGSDVLGSSLVNRMLFKIARKTMASADLFVVPSVFFMNKTKEKVGVEKERFFVSSSGGVDVHKFCPSKKFFGQGRLLVGYVSRIDRGKGWLTLLLSIKKIMREAPGIPVECIFVGSGGEKEKFMTACQELGLNKRINFLGRVGQEELVPLYQSMDVLVFPTELPESLGLCGIEAMACGTPVIGSGMGATKEYIIDNINGYVFEVKCEKSLSDKLVNYYKLSSVEKENLSCGARSTAMKYSSQEVSESLFQALNEINGNVRF